MNINYNKYSQFELFPDVREDPAESIKYSPTLRELKLSLENVIIISIILILVVVLFFSLGVERGKKLALSKNNGILSTSQELEEESVLEIKKTSGEDILSGKEIRIKAKEIQAQIDTQEDFQKTYTIQVASFKLERNAQTEADNLKEIGYNSFVLPKGRYSIVCVGEFFERDEAKEFSYKLKEKYSDCMIRRL